MSTLYLGCSHSLGTYDLEDKLVDHINSIPYVTSKKFNQKWKSISLPGHGIFSFAMVIEHLIQESLFDFDNVIIQQTHEPRLQLVEQHKFFLPIIQYIISDKDTTHTPGVKPYWWSFPINMIEQYQNEFTTAEGKLDYLNYIEDFDKKFNVSKYNPTVPSAIWIDMAYKYIQDQCAKFNTNLYSFTWSESHRDSLYIKTTRNISFDGMCVKDWIENLQGVYVPDGLLLHVTDQTKLLSNVGNHPLADTVKLIAMQLSKELTSKGYK